jgi:hypothetical protein
MTDSEKRVEDESMTDKADASDISIVDLLSASETTDEDNTTSVLNDDEEQREQGILDMGVLISELAQNARSLSSMPPTPVPPPPQAQNGSTIAFAVLGLSILIAAVVVYFAFRNGGNQKSEEFVKLQAQLTQITEAQTEQEQVRLKEKLALEEAAGEAAAAKTALEQEISAEKAAFETVAQKETIEQVVEGSVARAAAPARNRNRKTPKEAVELDVNSATPNAVSGQGGNDKSEKAEPSERETTGEKTGSDELDTLLGGSNPEKKQDNEGKAAVGEADDGIPRRPGKEDVKEVMGTVVSKAKTCSKYSTGTVQVRITVGNDGRVAKSETLGSFANTTAGKCVEMIARTAKFTQFKDTSFSFTYPVILQ